MAISRRQVVLASFVVCVTAFNAYAGIADETNASASAGSGQAGAGGSVSVNASWYTMRADRSITITVYAVNPDGSRGAAVGGGTPFAIPAGAGAKIQSFGPLPSGTYVATVVMTDSLSNVTAASVSNQVTLP